MSETNQKIDWKHLFEGYSKEIPIVLHNFPDPDAIASAMGIQHVLKHHGHKPGSIYYTGEVSHPQNKSMVTLLNLSLINYEEEPFEDGQKVILVDTNNVGPGSNQDVINPDRASVAAVVDHHKGKFPKGAKVDNRFVGSTASIVYDYLQDCAFDFETDDGKLLATALMVGLFTDTNSMMSESVSELDIEAYRNLHMYVDRQKLVSIMDYPLPMYLFDLRQKAFMDENKEIIESTIISGIGRISQSKRDALPIIADEFLRMTGIMTCVVFAIIDDHIDISVRSKDVALDVGDFVQKVFGSGGGKHGSGGAVIPLGFFSSNGDKAIADDTWELAKRLVFTKVESSVKGE
ncbi:MAG: hypothetical protein GF334_06935 [Candidatus Altiarchaeales archaeon]|nr:hypothetical protein [Candidatus Altiarchaeales archaeon]